MIHKIRKGLDIPIAGAPEPRIDDAPYVGRVALIGDDYVGMKPTMAVDVGARVTAGQMLFEDKKTPGVRFTSPGDGVVAEINRGAKRRFQSLVIELAEESDQRSEAPFASYEEERLVTLSSEQVRENLVRSGLWTSFRTRPFGRVPGIDTTPRSIFVTAIDTRPLAAPPERILDLYHGDFARGLRLLGKLTPGAVFVCARPETTFPGVEEDGDRLRIERFGGPHPAGLPGTHIHALDPVGARKTVWFVHYQDVIATGRLFVTGRLPTERIISVAGPAVKQPRLLRTRAGADIGQLLRDELSNPEARVLSGSVLSGREASGPFAYLGRYDLQVSALSPGGERILLDWLRPGWNRFSMKNVFASSLNRGVRFPLTTSQEGSPRAMVPIGAYERVMPLDILPTFLLRALIVGDTEQARELGCLELDEEDVALCSFVCPGKYEYGPLLRECLTRIEEEG